MLPKGSTPKRSVVYLDGVTGSAPLLKERILISLRGARLAPEFLVIPVGQTVYFANSDRFPHSLFSISPPRPFELGPLQPGDTRALTFDRTGVVHVFCNMHDAIQGAIVIIPSTYFALPADDGSFQLSGVPAGRYRLIAYTPEAEPAEQVSLPVEVRPRERTTIKLPLGPSAPPREKGK